MSDKKFSAIVGLGGNSYSNLALSADSAEELGEQFLALQQVRVNGSSVLELASETVRGLQGMYADALTKPEPPEFVVQQGIAKLDAEPVEQEKTTKAKATPRKGVAAKKKSKAEPEQPTVTEPTDVSDSVEAQIASAASGDELTEVWKRNKQSWTSEHSALAKARREELDKENG